MQTSDKGLFNGAGVVVSCLLVRMIKVKEKGFGGDIRVLLVLISTYVSKILIIKRLWATDKNNQKSVSGYITTMGGTSLVTWQSKKQQTVTLSSSESETMAMTVCAQDVLFVTNFSKSCSVQGRDWKHCLRT